MLDTKVQKLSWTTQQRKVSDLVATSYNPRKISDEAKKQLTKSLQKFDLAEIPAINTDNTILAGHQRVTVLLALGRGDEVIDVRVPNRKLSKAEADEYLLRSNANTGEWDFDILGKDFEIDLLKDIGFPDEELNFTTITPDDITQDECPDNVPKRAKLGDLWQLGNHWLLCGDSTKEDDVKALMGDVKADMCFTDPPYGVSYVKKGISKNKHEIKNDDLRRDELEPIIRGIFSSIHSSLKDDASYYITSPQGGELGMMMMMMNDSSIPCRHCLVWVKSSAVFSMGRLDYDYQHEPILYGWKKKHNFYAKGEFTKSVWEIDKPRESKLHPTMKPIALISNAILNSSKENDVVIDFCGGSGSTLIACEQTNRKCRMIELDEHYCDVIIERWENLTGKKAVKA